MPTEIRSQEEQGNPQSPWERLRAAETLYLPHHELEPLLEGCEEEGLREALKGDPWLLNYYLSIVEKLQARIELRSIPWHQAYAIADVCNARCPFCSSGFEKSGLMGVDVLPNLGRLISFARTLIFTGGEATVHPHFKEILEVVARSIDPRCFFSLITNGARLDRLESELLATPVSLAVSLNAATAATHQEIMQLGKDAWPRILESIRHFRRQGRYVAVSMVVTRQNLAEVPAFIDLAAELDVNTVYVRTLNPVDLAGGQPYPNSVLRVWENYPDLYPTGHPDFARLWAEARAAIAASPKPVSSMPDQWDVPPPLRDELAPQPLRSPVEKKRERGMTKGAILAGPREEPVEAAFQPYGRKAPMVCDHVYYGLQVLDQTQNYRACCFMDQVPGYDPVGLFAEEDFMVLRNSPAFLELRRRLRSGPLFPACHSCTYQLGY